MADESYDIMWVSMTKSGAHSLHYWLVGRRSGGSQWWMWGWTLSWVRWSIHLGPAIVLTRKGYKEHHWLVVPFINHFCYLSIHHHYSMPSSSCTIPGIVNHLGIGCAAVCIYGQASNRTNAGRAITPFMYNEEEYQVSPLSLLLHVFDISTVCSWWRRGQISFGPWLLSSFQHPWSRPRQIQRSLSSQLYSYHQSSGAPQTGTSLFGSIPMCCLLSWNCSSQHRWHWGQRGSYPGGKLRVYWEFLNNIPSICPLGKLRIFWNFISHFALNKPSG